MKATRLILRVLLLGRTHRARADISHRRLRSSARASSRDLAALRNGNGSPRARITLYARCTLIPNVSRKIHGVIHMCAGQLEGVKG
jgi:hypothetical protein